MKNEILAAIENINISKLIELSVNFLPKTKEQFNNEFVIFLNRNDKTKKELENVVFDFEGEIEDNYWGFLTTFNLIYFDYVVYLLSKQINLSTKETQNLLYDCQWDGCLICFDYIENFYNDDNYLSYFVMELFTKYNKHLNKNMLIILKYIHSEGLREYQQIKNG